MPNLTISSLLNFMKTCKDNTVVSSPKLGTKVYNLSDRPIELQIRVGSVLKKAHTLKPGSSKRLRSKAIYKDYYMAQTNDDTSNDAQDVYVSKNNQKGMKKNNKNYNMHYYCDDTCLPYVWIHEIGGHFSRMVKQQYLSLEDLRDCYEIRVFRDHQKGCIGVRKFSRS